MFCLEVSGDFACFTRPEMKVERVSYDVITPSAARAIFEAILWKPAIEWHIDKIEVINPIKWINVRRNELSSVVPMGSVKKAMNGTLNQLGNYIEEDRQQRAGLFLRDVKYRLYGHFTMTHKTSKEDNPGKFAEMFKRRAKKGQCVNQPYLGTREFACAFKLINATEESGLETPLDEDRTLGWMLYDLDFSDPANPSPMFFQAKMKKGVIKVPAKNSDEVRG
jgi:CRISPR-associated protein Cas5d